MARVLVVDDKHEIRLLLKAAVEHSGHTATLAADATDAWRKLNDRPDVVLADIGLPGVDGITLAEQIRNDSRFPHLPVIFVSARPNIEELIAGRVAEPVAVVEKPFHLDEIGRAIDQVMTPTVPSCVHPPLGARRLTLP